MDVLEQQQLTLTEALSHWYYRSKFNMLRKTLGRLELSSRPAQLADFGCGLGIFLRMLDAERLFATMCGIDSAYAAPTTLPGSRFSILPEFPRDQLYDVILLMDVLEHIEDDRAALELNISHCKPGGYLFITVPAFGWLWSAHDEFLGHYRRYDQKSLRHLLASFSEIDIVNLHYFFASILPFAAPVRLARRMFRNGKASDMGGVGRVLNWLLEKMLMIETGWATHNRFAGLSVVALVRKRPDATPFYIGAPMTTSGADFQ